MSSLQVLFFDAVGTLIRPAAKVGETYAWMVAHQGIQVSGDSVDRAFWRAWTAMPAPLHPPGQLPADDDRGWWHELVAKVFAEVLGTPLPAPVLAPLFEKLYEFYARSEAWNVFEDVVPALDQLAADHRLLVLSNFDSRLRPVLSGHDLLRFFDDVIISSEVGAAKPDQRMFQAALESAACAPEFCLHIGDDFKCDGEGAQAAGLGFFAVKRPGHGLDTLVQKVRAGAYSGLRIPRA